MVSADDPIPKKTKKVKNDGTAPPTVSTPTSSAPGGGGSDQQGEKGESGRMITPSINFIQQKQILPVISEFQQQTTTTANTPTIATTSGSTSGSSSTTTTTTDTDNVENPQHELIKKLLNANQLTLHQPHGQKSQVASGNIRSPQTESANRPITSVTEQELKSIGISLKHQECQMAAMSPAKSDDTSSIKSGSSTQPSTPTSAIPDVTSGSTSGALSDVKHPPSLSLQIKQGLNIKPETTSEKDIKNVDKEKSRKRKKSLDAKPIKKRKRGDENQTSPQQLIPLNLAEAPIRLNMDACPPLGGGTISQLGKDCEECGKMGWHGNWNYDGWIVNSANFYDVIKKFDRFEHQPRVEKTPDIISLCKEFEKSKQCFFSCRFRG